MSSLSTIFVGLSGLGGLAGVAALLNVLSQRSRVKAEAEHIGVKSDLMMSDQALEMYALTRREAQEAKEEAQECRRIVVALESHVDKLERIMWDNGLKPPVFKYPLKVAER